MSTPQPTTAPFDRKVLIGLGVFGVGSFLFGLLASILGPGWGEISSAGADTFSKSALGHRAAVEVLEALDVTVVVARNDPWRRTVPESVLVLAEPRVWQADSPRARRITATLERARGPRLVVLPRFSGYENVDQPGWVRTTWGAAPTPALLQTLGITGDVSTVGADTAWDHAAAFAAPAPPTDVQVLRDPDGLEPLIRAEGAVLFGRVGDGPTYVLTDPMLINTVGLSKPENAAFLVRLLAEMSPGGGPVVFDETLHGFGTDGGVWARLFEFPLVLATVQAVLVMALLLWVAMRRFGAPEPVPPALGRGRAVLIENVARMSWFAGHGGPVLARYWQATRRAVADGLHAPSHLADVELDAWLDRVATVRKVDERVSRLAPVVDAAALQAREAERLTVARRIHAWRQAMLGDP